MQHVKYCKTMLDQLDNVETSLHVGLNRACQTGFEGHIPGYTLTDSGNNYHAGITRRVFLFEIPL